MQQDQRDLSNRSDASESDEEELELTQRQLIWLQPITPQVPKHKKINKSPKSSSKMTPTVLDITKARVVEIMDMW